LGIAVRTGLDCAPQRTKPLGLSRGHRDTESDIDALLAAVLDVKKTAGPLIDPLSFKYLAAILA
jgi:selenocysteine lyase/cysteine desulfurase